MDLVHDHFYCYCSQVNAIGHIWWEVNIGLGNTLVPQGNKT